MHKDVGLNGKLTIPCKYVPLLLALILLFRVLTQRFSLLYMHLLWNTLTAITYVCFRALTFPGILGRYLNTRLLYHFWGFMSNSFLGLDAAGVAVQNDLFSNKDNRAASSEFVSSSIPSWQTLTAHAQPFREARDLAFCLKVPLDSLLVWASSEGSGETARMRRLAWTFAARIGYKYQIRLTRSNRFPHFNTKYDIFRNFPYITMTEDMVGYQ